MKFYLILNFLFLLPLFALDKLPDTMPEDIKIAYYKSLGHAGRGFSMELTRTDCNYIDKMIRKENKIEFKLSAEELTSVYQTLIENKVHKITYEDTNLIHDYDGPSLQVSWGNKSISITQSGRKVKSNWRNEWNNIITHLDKIKEREIKNAVKDIEFYIDKSVSGNFIHLQIDGASFVFRKYIDASVLKENPIRFKLLTGAHTAFLMLYKNYDIKKKEEIYADFDPSRPSLWEQNHNQYINSLKNEMFELTLDTKSKKSFQLIKQKDKLVIQ